MIRWQSGVATALLILMTGACKDDPEPTTQVNEPVRAIGGDRPATLNLPNDYVAGTPIPLVLVLHGFTSNAGWTDDYFGISQRIDADRIAVILPNGTRDPDGQSFWNGTDYCCDLHQSGIDDVAYLNGLVEEASEHMAVDGVYLIGLSNGGFMSYRMACESMPGLRAIAAVAGTTFVDPARCEGAAPISVLHIHGTADNVIRYGGGTRRNGEAGYPGAVETVSRWAARAECEMDAADALPAIDLVAALDSDETGVTRYRSGCQDGLSVELWTIDEGPHVPGFDAAGFGSRVVAWFRANGG